MFLDADKSPESIAEYLFLSRNTLTNYLKRYQVGGLTAVYYVDGTHPQHNTHFAYGWIRKGQNKEIKSTRGSQRVNINGAVNPHDPTDVVIRRAPPLMLNTM